MPESAKPRLPPWIGTVILSLFTSGVGAGGGSAITMAVMEWRLTAVETTLAEALTRERDEEWGAIKQRLEVVERRTDDDAFSDWTTWRAHMDSRMTGIEVDVRDMQRRPINGR